MSKQGHSTDKIPKGDYCYDENGLCPYWSANHDKPNQEYGHCSFLGWGDWQQRVVTHLWDQVKECGINLDDEDWGNE